VVALSLSAGGLLALLGAGAAVAAGAGRASVSQIMALLFLGAAAVVVAAGAGLVVSMSRLVNGPITRLAAQVRQVASGEYDLEIEERGPPELAGLARDVDHMRRRIAADLIEVRAARQGFEAATARLEAQAAELARSNRDLEQFAYVASHEMQEPLRKVASFCQLLQRRYGGKLDERADRYIAFAVESAQRMQRLINDLLAFSQIGHATGDPGLVDLDGVMTEVAKQVDSSRRYASGRITWADLPVVRGDEPMLATLLANLVSNSLKFRRRDHPPQVHVSARRVGDEWEITCQDNGIGVTAESAEQIFVIFQRLHARDAYPGTGIGLAIAKKVVDHHGGRIWADAEVAEGAAIRFTLPVVAEPPDAPVPAETDAPVAAEVAAPASPAGDEASAVDKSVPTTASSRGVSAEAEPGAPAVRGRHARK
jgi:signal transduction histidine kinase